MYTFEIQFEDHSEIVTAYYCDDLPDIDFPDAPIVRRKGAKQAYLNLEVSFDIETTTIEVDGHAVGFMYHWQVCVGEIVIFGRRWEEWQYLLEFLANYYSLNEHKRMVIYSHFLQFEFQHYRNFVDVESVFARKERTPMKTQFNGAFESRCSYFLTNMGLGAFIENTEGARFNKQSGKDFNYRKIRTPDTPMSDLELGYCYCDVRGLCEGIRGRMKEHNLAEIPLTSTGYVRNEVREAVLSNKNNRRQFTALALDPVQYTYCKTARRGGNCHANALYTGHIIKDMKSVDRKSSYPAEMVVGRYPITKFREMECTWENIKSYMGELAMLIDCVLYEVDLKQRYTLPYIALAKCTSVTGYSEDDPVLVDNGRVVRCKSAGMVITDIDLDIILATYDVKEIEIKYAINAEYGQLNNEFRLNLMEKFTEKCRLELRKKENLLLYNKFKNKINAYFGMMLTDITSPEICYNACSADEPWTTQDPDITSVLEKYYKNRRSFLSYQHGVWVTANARKAHQEAITILGSDIVYGDTDSVKFIGDHDKDIKFLNEKWLERCYNNDINPIVRLEGREFILGIWDDDGEYDEFITLGAKKYAYRERGEENVEVTVAGLSKEDGADYLNKNGKLTAFKIGTVIPPEFSGRTSATFNDVDAPYIMEVDGCRFTNGSNIGVTEVPYTFGVSDDYWEYFIDTQGAIYHDEKNGVEKYEYYE